MEAVRAARRDACSSASHSALGDQLQTNAGHLRPILANILPYAVTLIALVGLVGRSTPPAADGAAVRAPVTRIWPQLSVRRGREAVAWYVEALGAVEDYRVGGTDGMPELVAQLSIGDAVFWVSDESQQHGNFSPESLGGGTVRMALVVDDPRAAMARAVAAGAREVYPAAEEHGWLLGRIEDPFGHHWEVGKPLGPWPPPA